MDVEHEVTYPPALLELETRELLHRSQTNVTRRHPEFGFLYAVAAYDKALRNPDENDPTAASEAAAKAGFRAEQLGLAASEVNAWFDRSFEGLTEDDPKVDRERIATYLLEGRANALRATRRGQPKPERNAAYYQASAAFSEGRELIRELHIPGDGYDPYGTMLLRHWATMEAALGNRKLAARLALGGITMALQVRQENTNTPEHSAGRRLLKNAKFVGKQVVMNATALALTKVPTQTLRRISAHRMLS